MSVVEELTRRDRGIPDLVRDPSEQCLATFWRQASPGTAYWRCELPARHLPGQELGFWPPDDVKQKDGEFYLPRQRGTAVWAFLGDDWRARAAIAQAENGIRTLMEVDDNYTRGPAKVLSGWTKTYVQSLTQIGYSYEQHRYLIPLVDGMIVSTPYLKTVYDEFHDKVYVCRNSVDLEDWPTPEKPDDGVFRIGYMASGSHAADWPLVKKALKWAHRQKGVEVHIQGFQPPGWSGDTLPWTDTLPDYRKALAILDVGICPLQNNEWNKSKSDVKAMEYTMAGVVPIVSRTESYRPWWEGLGWLSAQSPDEWMAVIRDVVRNRDMIPGLQAQARLYVENERLIQQEIGAWKEAVLDGKNSATIWTPGDPQSD